MSNENNVSCFCGNVCVRANTNILTHEQLVQGTFYTLPERQITAKLNVSLLEQHINRLHKRSFVHLFWYSLSNTQYFKLMCCE